MRYLGGKGRIASKLAAFMRPIVQQRGVYVEPFVGAASVLAVQEAPIRIAGDTNTALITMWQALAAGWSPPESVSEEVYLQVKAAADPTDPLTAFVGFGCSFAGKWFDGYARSKDGCNYAAMAASSLRRKMRGLCGVSWYAADYTQCPTPPGAVIYCDPPYAGTTSYDGVASFNHEGFWDWCRMKHARGFAVFVSEYAAPSDFHPVFEVTNPLAIGTKRGMERRVERLFSPAKVVCMDTDAQLRRAVEREQ